jgi:hypothetical protein
MVALALCALLALAGSAAFAQWPAPRAAAGTPASGAASSANAVQPAAVTPPKPAHAEPGAGGVHDGIVVHGHWVIDVKNADGTVTAHRDFENSLTAEGAYDLAALLVGGFVPGGWAVFINGNSSSGSGATSEAGPCLPFSFQSEGSPQTSPGPASGGMCVLAVAPNSQGDGSFWTSACEQAAPVTISQGTQVSPCSTSLSVTGPGQYVSTIVLTGSVPVTATVAGTVNDVETSLQVCPGIAPGNLATPGNCATAFNSTGGVAIPDFGYSGVGSFTQKILDGKNGDPTAVPYNPGQTVSVTVTLSFS